jgi:hypothetical protein
VAASIQIQIHAQRVEPFEEHRARVGLLVDKQKLIAGLWQLFDERAPWRIGCLAAFDAAGVKAREPALARSAMRAMGVLLVAIEIRPHRGAAG